MQHDEFIGQVQARARLASRGEAERATRATLETLGERIPEGTADNVAAQLPIEVRDHLLRTVVMGGLGTGERFGFDEFITRVANREGVDEPKATYDARVVLEVVREATGESMMRKVCDSLPADLERLVTAGSKGPLPPAP